MGSKNYEESGYGLGLDLLTISHNTNRVLQIVREVGWSGKKGEEEEEEETM